MGSDAADSRRDDQRANPPTLLVVDDEPQLLALLIRVFERGGFRVLSARDGRAALELFKAHRDEICAAFLDVVIPPDGVGPLLDQICSLRDDLGVVLTSGDEAGRELNERLSERGGRFIRKPFTPDVALRAVNEVLEEQR